MIIIRQVRRDQGQVLLRVEYDDQGGTKTIWIDQADLIERFREFRNLIGRKPSEQERKEIFVKLISELREKKEPLIEIIPWENYIGVDLEVQK